MFRNIILFFALFSSLGVSLYFFFTPHIKPLTSSEALVEESMSGVTVTRFDKMGRLNQIATIASWQHLKDQSVTTMEHPSLKIHYPDGSICEISADKGEGFQPNLKSPLEKLHLIDNVTIHQLGNRPDSWLELKTTSLLYFPDSASILTDEPVTVLGPFMYTQAQGMRAYLDTHRIEFINRVNSQYAKHT